MKSVVDKFMNYKIFFIFICVVLMISNIQLTLANNTKAFIVESVKPDHMVLPGSNLIISSSHPYRPITISVLGDINGTTQQYDIAPGGGGLNWADDSIYKLEEWKKQKFGAFQAEYGATTFALDANNPNTVIQIRFPEVGKYQNRPVGVNATYSNFKPRQSNLPFDFQNPAIQISHSLYSGYYIANIDSVDIQYQFFYTDTNEIISLENSFYSVNSLNGPSTGIPGEYVIINTDTVNKVYVREDTNIGQQHLAGNLIKFYGITDTGFVDWLGDPLFTKNSVTMFQDDVISLTIGHDEVSAMWATISTAPIGIGQPTPPVKTVSSGGGNMSDKTDTQVGQDVIFEVAQKVNHMGVDTTSRYDSFSIIDPLPSEVDYKSAQIFDGNGNEITGGSMIYDHATHTVTYHFDKAFLDTMPMQGETYTLRITTVANTAAEKVALFKNKAHSVINGFNQDSNEVEVKVPKPELSIQKVIDGNNGIYQVGDYIPYKITVQQTVPNAIARNVVISDYGITEGAEIDMQSIQVTGVAE